jgi:hypothetical protein
MNEGFMRRDEGLRDGGSFDIRQPIWNRHCHAGIDACILGVRSAAHDGHDAVCRLKFGHFTAELDNFASNLQARNQRVTKIGPVTVKALPLQDVGTIQSSCVHPHQQIMRSQLRKRLFQQLDHVGLARAFEPNSSHGSSLMHPVIERHCCCYQRDAVLLPNS